MSNVRWDRFGWTQRPSGEVYVDLSLIKTKVMPACAASGLHLYSADGLPPTKLTSTTRLSTTAWSLKGYLVEPNMKALDDFLEQHVHCPPAGGVVYLAYAYVWTSTVAGTTHWAVRIAHITEADQVSGMYGKPRTPDEIAKEFERAQSWTPEKVGEQLGLAKMEADRYPHKCDRCGAPAYIGLNEVDCQAGCSR